jgi:hypothetical protein
MKTKKVFWKKLVLNKKTVADLNNSDLAKIYGGVRTIHRTDCVTNCFACPSFKCA